MTERSMMLFLKLGCYWLLAACVFFFVEAALSAPLPPSPRLGYRGTARHQALSTNTFFALVEPLLRFVAALIQPLPLSRLRAHQEQQLRRSGYWLGLTSNEIIAMSLLSALTFGALITGLSSIVDNAAAFVVPAASFGLILPQLKLNELVRKRIKDISRGLPHAIEIAALCMGAGLDFPGSIRMLVRSGDQSRDPLTREFASILDELDLGHTRREALLGFAERVPTAAVRDFVNAVVQAEQKGNPLAQVIQVQGRMLSMRRSTAAEEAAVRAGVLMMGPMVLLLGCVLLLLMGPFVVKGVGL